MCSTRNLVKVLIGKITRKGVIEEVILFAQICFTHPNRCKYILHNEITHSMILNEKKADQLSDELNVGKAYQVGNMTFYKGDDPNDLKIVRVIDIPSKKHFSKIWETVHPIFWLPIMEQLHAMNEDGIADSDWIISRFG